MAQQGLLEIEPGAENDSIKAYKKWMTESRLLDWFKSREDVMKAFDIIEKHQKDGPSVCGHRLDIENLIVGPALKYAFRANYITWGGFFFLTIFAWFLVEVDEKGIANPPTGKQLLVGVAIFVVGGLFCLLDEVRAAMYVLPCQAVAIKKPGMGMPFWLWLLVMAIISFALHADIYTTAIFIARVAKSTTANVPLPRMDCNELLHGELSNTSHVLEGCRQHFQNQTFAFLRAMHNPCNTVNYQWQQVVNGGRLSGQGVGWFFQKNSFVQLAAYAGCLMFLQFIYSLCYSWPVSPDLKAKEINEDYPATHMVDGEGGREITARYNTAFKTTTGHGRALQALAESGRMNILNWQDDAYLEVAEQEWESRNVVQEMRRGNMRFLMFGLQSIVIPNLQITYLGIQNAQRSGQADWLTFASSCLTVTCGMKYIVWELQTLNSHYRFAVNALKADRQRAKDNQDNSLAWGTRTLTRWVTVRHVANRCFCIFFLVMYVYLALKAYMDMVGCNGRIWNWDNEFFWNTSAALQHSKGCMTLNFNVSLYHVAGDSCVAGGN